MLEGRITSGCSWGEGMQCMAQVSTKPIAVRGLEVAAWVIATLSTPQIPEHFPLGGTGYWSCHILLFCPHLSGWQPHRLPSFGSPYTAPQPSPLLGSRHRHNWLPLPDPGWAKRLWHCFLLQGSLPARAGNNRRASGRLPVFSAGELCVSSPPLLGGEKIPS